MVGGLSFCPSIIRLSLYHPGSYIIIIGVCKTHPAQVDTDIPWKPMQAASSNGGCTCVGFFRFQDFLHFGRWLALVLICKCSGAEDSSNQAQYNSVAHLVTFQLAEIFSSGEGWPGGLFSLSSSTAFSKKLAVCLNSTLISDIELIFSICNSEVDLKSQPWGYP